MSIVLYLLNIVLVLYKSFRFSIQGIQIETSNFLKECVQDALIAQISEKKTLYLSTSATQFKIFENKK